MTNEGAGMIGAGFQGFVQGWRDADDRNQKRIEMEARAKTMEDTRKRERFLDALELRAKGFQVPEGQDVYATDPSQLQYDPKYLAMKNRESRLSADPLGLKALQVENAKAELENKKRPTEGEFTAGGFAKRAKQAEGELERLTTAGFNPASKSSAIQGALPESGVVGMIAESNKDPKFKSYSQAKRNFISAVLRKESGAAISDKEYTSEDKKYFAQVGDTPEVIEQKRMARAQAIANLSAQGGRAMGLIPDAGGLVSGGLTKSAAPKDDPVSAQKLKRLEELRKKAAGG
jgi:hypothetical protein